jgi:hypothetical protein
LIFKYKTAIPVDECRSLLRNTDGMNSLFFTGNKSSIRGWIWGRWFCLWWQEYLGPFRLENSFKTFCFGKLYSKQNETVIRMYIGMHPLVVLFFFIWFGALLGIAGFYTAYTLSNPDHSNGLSLLFLYFFVGIFVCVGLMFLMIGRGVSLDDRYEITYFLKSILDASESG